MKHSDNEYLVQLNTEGVTLQIMCEFLTFVKPKMTGSPFLEEKNEYREALKFPNQLIDKHTFVCYHPIN